MVCLPEFGGRGKRWKMCASQDGAVRPGLPSPLSVNGDGM